MAEFDEAYDAFNKAFSEDEHGQLPGRTAAMRAGAHLIRVIATSPEEMDPQVRAAQIQAIGSMVGHFVEAHKEHTIGFDSFAELRIAGVNPPHHPSKLKIELILPKDPEDPPTA